MNVCHLLFCDECIFPNESAIPICQSVKQFSLSNLVSDA